VTISKLERYLSRPRARVFDDVTLVQYYEKYKVCKMEQLPAYARRLSWLDAHPTRRLYVYRLRGAEHFVYLPRNTPGLAPAGHLELE
jgi:hypothetical protein